MLLAFIPMLCTAAAYYYLNRADPDCGTTFSWATLAFGPWLGWIGGWAIIVADIIVMSNLAAIAGAYSFLLVGADDAANNTNAVLVVGVLWIVLMTLICYVGIELSAKTQWYLLGAELITLAALRRRRARARRLRGHRRRADAVARLDQPVRDRVDERARRGHAARDLHLLGLGLDRRRSTRRARTAAARPGIAAIVSTVILLGIYLLVSVAALAYHGVDFLTADENLADVLGALGSDVLGSPLDKLLIIAVLTSAAASTQTTILPTTRTALSMAARGAAPRSFARDPPEVPDAELRDDLDGRALDRLVRRPDDLLARTSSSTGCSRSA